MLLNQEFLLKFTRRHTVLIFFISTNIMGYFCLYTFGGLEVFSVKQIIFGVVMTFIGFGIYSASLQGVLNVSFNEAFEVSKQLSKLKLQQKANLEFQQMV